MFKIVQIYFSVVIDYAWGDCAEGCPGTSKS